MIAEAMEGVRSRQSLFLLDGDQSSASILGWTVALAILLHVLLLQAPIQIWSVSELTEKKNDSPIVVESADPTGRKPVVTTSKALDQDETNKGPAPFHAEIQNRTKKQTRAPLLGKFEEGVIKRGSGGSGALEEDIMGEPGVAGEPGSKLGMNDLMSFAKTPHALSKDIQEGGQTVLNTDKVLYASFINRIAEEIYEPWVQYGQDAIREVLSRGRKIEPTTYITKINVVMNESGEVVAMTVLEGSSLDELDDAPKKAFWKIARFPNPPIQLVDSDGLIRLTYEFHFEWKSSFFNIVPWQI